MVLKEKNGISFFQFPNLAKFPEIRHGIFTRKSGFSKEPYKSLNISFGVGDNKDRVHKNRNAVMQCIGNSHPTELRQIHGTDVVVLSDTDKSMIQDISADGDALVTDIKNQMLLIKVADCQAVLMYDPSKKIIANVHSGWRGSINNVIGRCVDVMAEQFSCNPQNLVAGISPSLGPCCAEFVNYRKEIPKRFWKYKDDSNRFDFWKISKDQLCSAGVSEQNINISRMCTCCNTDLFFSFRGEGATGRFAAVIGMV